MLPTPPPLARPWLPAWWSLRSLPLRPPGPPRRLPAALMGLFLVGALGLGLAGCSGIGQPSQGVLLRALGLQIALTQRSIASALALEPAGLPQVSRVRVEHQEEVAIADGRGLHLSGRFDWRLADDPIRVDSPFELWLQRGERGQVWRLARPLAAGGPGQAGIEPGGLAGADLHQTKTDQPQTNRSRSDQPERAQVGLAQDWLIDPLPLPGESAS